MNYFFWFFLFPFVILIPLIIIVAVLVEYVVAREKRDPQFAVKMDRFRATTERMTPNKKQKEFITTLLVIGLLLCWIFYNP